jgi:activator of HSP90 ATPase
MMSDSSEPSTRRQLMVGSAIALGALATVRKARAKMQQQAPAETRGAAANRARTSVHQEVRFKASPRRIYDILLDSKQFAAFTGMPAEINPEAGGAFNMFGGLIVGRNVELLPGQRLVQAWRPTHWESGVYSIVRFEVRPQESGSLMILDHTGFPEGAFDDLDAGWKARYWEPLQKFLAS